MPEDKLNRTSPYPLSRLSAPFEPNDQALARVQAHEMLGTVTSAKLQVVYDQIRRLQEEAQKMIAAAEDNARLHTASCRFTKRTGHVYHLYSTSESDAYFSMLSPAEWGVPPHDYVGSYRLERDMTWTAVDYRVESINVTPVVADDKSDT